MYGCRELTTVTCSETCLVVGARITLSQLEASLTDLRQKLPGTEQFFVLT